MRARSSSSIEKKRSLWRSVLVALGVLGLAFGSLWLTSVWGRQSLTVDGMTRYYRVHMPPSYGRGERVPLVLAFHRYTGTARTMEWTTRLNDVADENGFTVAYLDGYKGSWADGSGQFAADQAGIDDVAFVSAVIQELTDRLFIDPSRIYATGFSNGGFFAQRLACELPELAAVATVGAGLTANVLSDCRPESPISILMIHGTEDGGVPWEGTSKYVSVPDTVAHWVAVNACAAKPVESKEPDLADDGTRVRRLAYTGCAKGSEVVLYEIEGGGHTWPGGNKPAQLWGLATGAISEDLDASRAIWAFFEGHSR